MKKWLTVLLIVAVVLTIGTAGLAKSEVVIRVSGYGGIDVDVFGQLMDRVSATLKAQGIKVAYEPVADDYVRTLMNSLSSGTGPDLFYLQQETAEGFIASNKIEPLNNYLAASKISPKKDFIPSLISAYSKGGKIYGIAKDFNTLVLYYNKDLFDLAKVPYPDENDTWATLESKLAKVTNKDKQIYGMAVQPEVQRMGAFAVATGWNFFDKKGRTNLLDPNFKRAFTWYTGLVKKGIGVVPSDVGQGWGGGAFTKEIAATCIEGAWLINSINNDAPNMRYGTTLLPKDSKTGKRGTLIYSVAWAMNKDGKHKKEAFKVLEQLTSAESQQFILEHGMALPSRAALINSPYFKQDTAAAKANYTVLLAASKDNAFPFVTGVWGNDWANQINEPLRAVLTNSSSADDALQEAQKRIEELMKR